MSKFKLHKLFGIAISALCLIVVPLQSQAANKGKAQVAQPTKERLVLMPLRVGEDIQNMLGAMETALAQGLQLQYTVFAGEDVAKKTREIFKKESAKKNCDETRCMEDIAIAFQSELIATANVTKIEGGYLLALSIRNVMDNKAVYNNSLPCKGCDAFQVVDKLKELSGTTAPAIPQTPAIAVTPEPVAPAIKATDTEGIQWIEVQKGNSIEDYEAYLSQYPKGKFDTLAKGRIKKLKEQEASNAKRQQEQSVADQAKQDQSAWENANSTATEISYQNYLRSYPQGSYANLATARIAKHKREAAEAANRAPKSVTKSRALQEAEQRTLLLEQNVRDMQRLIEKKEEQRRIAEGK